MPPIQPRPVPTPVEPAHFDYLTTAREAGISQSQLAAIIRLFESDYPYDLMLRELHILRACNALKDGSARVESFLDAAPPASAA